MSKYETPYCVAKYSNGEYCVHQRMSHCLPETYRTEAEAKKVVDKLNEQIRNSMGKDL